MGIYGNYPDGIDGTHHHFNEPDAPEAEVIDTEADAEAIEKLAVAQALYKVISAQVKTGDPCNLRGAVDEIMERRFNDVRKLGVAPKSFDVEIAGEKVGTYSITLTKDEPKSTDMELRVESQAELFKWACEQGYIEIDMKAVDAHFSRTGEVPKGCAAIPVTREAVKGGKIARTTLRIDPESVVTALGSDLLYVTQDLLEGGE